MSKVVVAGVTDQTASGSTPGVLVDSGGRVAINPPAGTSATQVQGTAAAGQAAGAFNPVIVGGIDGSGNARAVAFDASGNQQVVGNVASGATDSGNPVKVGGKYNSAPPSLTDGQRADLQVTSNGNLKVAIYDGGNSVIQQATNADGVAAVSGTVYLPTVSVQRVFNGTTYDRQRSNMDTGALITAAGATTSQTGADQTNYNGRGIIVVLDMTTVGTGSVTLTIQGKDTASGKYYTLLAGAAVTTNSTNVYSVFPAATVTANVSANSVLPRTWRVITTANNANAATYTVGASVVN